MKEFTVNTKHGKFTGLTLSKSLYVFGGTLSVTLWDKEGDEFATLTVNLQDNSLAESEAYLDTNNCPWAVEFVESNKLGERTGKTKDSGFCTYPLVRFDMEKLNEVCIQMNL